jgi:hypothetical protein
MIKKLTKLESAVWMNLKYRHKRSKRIPHLYDDAETFKAALENARHHNNQHRKPKNGGE